MKNEHDLRSNMHQLDERQSCDRHSFNLIDLNVPLPMPNYENTSFHENAEITTPVEIISKSHISFLFLFYFF